MNMDNMGTQHVGGAHKAVLGTYRSHDAAQHAVELLAESDFPVEHVTVVGTGLKLEEQVTGRWTLARAVLAGATTGAWVGLLIGLIFLIVSPWAGGAIISAIVLGVLFGVVFGAVAHAFQRRTFVSVPGVVADRYDVLVDADFADEARHALATALSASEDKG